MTRHTQIHGAQRCIDAAGVVARRCHRHRYAASSRLAIDAECIRRAATASGVEGH